MIAAFRSANKAAFAAAIAFGQSVGFDVALGLALKGESTKESSVVRKERRVDLLGVNGLEVAFILRRLSRRFSSSTSSVFSITAPLMLRTVRLTASREGVLSRTNQRRVSWGRIAKPT